MKDVLIYRIDHDDEVFEIRDTMYQGQRVERTARLFRYGTITEMKVDLYPETMLDPARVRRTLQEHANRLHT